MFGFRTLDPDPQRAQALVRAVRIYPTRRPGPRPRRGSSRPRAARGPAIQPRGLDYWARLHDIYQHEIVDERDRFYLAMLQAARHREGQRRSHPDERLTRDPDPGVRRRRADGAGQHLRQAVRRRAVLARPAVGPGASSLDNSAQRGDGYDELLERASWFYEAVSFSDGDEEPDARAWARRTSAAYTDADGELARRRPRLHACTSRRTRRPSCSGRPRSTTWPPAA